VFWAATDDSDFAEASSTVLATPDGAVRITMAEPEGTGVALAQVPLGDVTEQIGLLEAAAGSASAARVLELVRSAYAGERTVGGAYVQLLRAILEPLGVSVLDAAHPAVRTAAHPLLVRSLECAGEIEATLAERSRALKVAGHAAQVKLVAGRSLAFAESNGRRERIMIRDAKSAATGSAPGTLGPNVLLRPIVERSILPTVAYVGGPAEVAYFAQVTAVAEALDVAAPLVLPRWSGFVIEPRIKRILDRHALKVEDFSDPHAVETRLARESIPQAVTEAIETLRSSVDKSIADIGSAGADDLVPNGVLEGLERNVVHRIERLERRIAAGIKRRGTDALNDAAIARGALYPFGSPQERSLNFVPLLARYGDDLVEQLLTEIRAHVARFA
ncbi:MAG: bacillithiol biosynthesis protein BshC, partial [Gemmatimonadaceae bacterium]